MLRCNICRAETGERVELGQVRSNVRRFRAEKFTVWRCPKCLSLHARDEVDLAHYYSDYPFHHLPDPEQDVMLRATYNRQLARLKQAGLRREHQVLDYGCGGGALVRFLQKRGYANVHGYDQYSAAFSDRSVLERRYDFIVSQDVLEHVPEPWDFLHEVSRLLAPGGIVAIGTPNAESIDLKQPEQRVHTLHQPYHRHIFSKRKLLTLGDELGWELIKYYPTMYANTLVPFVNAAFVNFYFKCHDDTLDLAIEPINPKSWKLWTPVSLFLGLFGYFFAPECDVMAVYRAPAALPSSTDTSRS
jgi:SAM-dependent methyltransferase